jgi:acyl-CoA synthetase (AMP-forming)/AMP-acid ligase II
MRAIDYFDKGAEKNPDRVAILDGARSYTYRQVRELTQQIACAMRAEGLRDEDRAAIYSPNDARVLVCMVAMMRAGAAWVPLNSRNAIDATIEYMNYVSTSWLFYHSSFRSQIADFKARVPSLQHLICIDANDAGNPSLEEFAQRGAGQVLADWGDPYGNNERIVGLVPTGGTTGPAKGVCVTSMAWGTMLDMAAHYYRGETHDPICLVVAPLSHAAGPVAFAAASMGATNVVLPGFDAQEVARAIEKYRVTHLFLPPTALYKMLALPDVANFDYSSLRVFLLVGSPVSPDKLKRAVEVFGPCMCQSYGQTEAPMLLTFLDQKTTAAAASGDHPERLASCGQATSAVRLGIMDDEGRLLGENQPGEIVVRGTIVTGGYYNLPEATAEVRKFGWHHTGDVGYRDADGFYYISDRKKDMIITGGFNVFSAEVEAGIMALPEVHECAVVGVPDELWGEAVKAFVVLREGATLTEGGVIEHCRVKLGGVKTPKSVEFRAEIPKTPAGKTDRKGLRAPYWSGAKRAVH